MPYLHIKGACLHYLDEGEGFPLLFGHSYLLKGEQWRQQINYLKRFYRCIVPDLWNHGRSGSSPYHRLNTVQIAKDYWYLMNQLGLDQFGVIGFGEGALWGSQLAVSYPESVSLLVFISAHLEEESNERLHKAMRMLDLTEQYQHIPNALIEHLSLLFCSQPKTSHQRAIAELFKKWLHEISPNQLPGLIHLGRQFISRTSLLESLENIAVPTLLMCGSENLAYPAQHTINIQKNLFCEETLIVQNACHLLNLECPELTNQIVFSFLRSNLVQYRRSYLKAV